MKFDKVFVILTLMIMYNNCNNPHTPYKSDSEEFYFDALNGNTKDIIVNDDTLYVANSEEALKIYKISSDEGRVSQLDYVTSHYDFDAASQTGFDTDKEIRKIIYAKFANYRVPVSMFHYGSLHYSGVPDFNPEELQCFSSTNITQFTIDSTLAIDDEIILYVINRSLPESQYQNNPGTSSIIKYNLSYSNHDILGSTVESSCSTILDSLNYQTTDLHFYNNLLGISNSIDGDYYVELFNTDDLNSEGELNSSFLKIKTESKPLDVIILDSQTILTGLSDYHGCYITLLDNDGHIDANFTIASGFSVINIVAQNDIIVLNCGGNGVLVYKRNGNNFDYIASLNSFFAYNSAIYDTDPDDDLITIFVASKIGIEIYNLEI